MRPSARVFLPRTIAPAGSAQAPPAAVTEPPRFTAPPQGPVTPEPPRRPERLSVTAEHAPGAEASIDGAPFERLPIVERLVGRGLRRLVVRAPGFRTLQTAVVVMEGSDMSFDVTPDEMPPLLGLLIVEPRGASAYSVRVDGAPADGPPYAVTLPEGDHRVEVSAAGLPTSGVTVAVEADKAKRLVIDLRSRYPSPLAVGVVASLVAAAVAAAITYSSGRTR